MILLENQSLNWYKLHHLSSIQASSYQKCSKTFAEDSEKKIPETIMK